VRRLAVILATVCVVSPLAGVAHAQDAWQDFQNTGGFTAPVTSSCFLYASAAFNVQCYTPSTGLTLGASALTVDLSTGVPGGQAVIGGTGTTDSLTVQATNATPASGAKIYLQTKFGNDYYDPVVHTLGLGVGTNPISMFLSGTQLVAKSGGDLQIGTVDGHGVELLTNGLTAVQVDSTQHVVLPIMGGGGIQCVQVNNTGQLSPTGAVCGSGSGGVTSVTASPPLFSSGGATPNITEQGAIVSGSTSTTAQNLGALASGVMQEIVSAGVATVNAFASTSGEVQFGAASGGGLADDPTLFWDNGNKRLGIGTASPSVSFQDQATVNGDLMGGIVNASTGTAARSLWAFGSVAFANPSLTLLVDGVNYSSAGGLYTAGSSIWYYNASATSHLLFQNQSGDTIFSTGASPVGGVAKLTITNAGHVQVADLAVGGMTKSTASAGQLAVAVAGTDYAPVGACLSHQFATATNASTLTCVQPAISDLQFIGAHTIVANATALAAAPAQTSIGTTLAFDGTSQLQCVGLRDGGGVNHVTTGTWPISSVIETDVSGNIAAEAQLACGQSEGPWTGDARKSAGSCAVTNVAITETSGPTSLTIGAIPNSAPDSTTLIRPAGSPTIVGVATSTVVSAAVTKLSFSLQLQLGSSIPNTWLLQGGPGLFSNGALIEYPNDFAAGHIQVIWYLRSNVVTAGTLTAFASRNGTAVTGSGISVSPTTTATVHVGTPLATGSTSATDTYGIGFSTSGTYAAASPTSVFLTFEVILTP